jgi:hypothetical protein
MSAMRDQVKEKLAAEICEGLSPVVGIGASYYLADCIIDAIDMRIRQNAAAPLEPLESAQ